jgi:PilZ domain
VAPAAPGVLETGGIVNASRNPKRLRIVKPDEVTVEAIAEKPGRNSQLREELGGRAGPAFPSAKPRRFSRVPTHVVGVADEQRAYPRAALRLPLRLRRVAGELQPAGVTLLTRNISSSGAYFLCPCAIEPGTPIELEVGLVERPIGQGSVRMTTAAHVVRVEPCDTPGWYGLAASFDDFTFQRDEPIPPRFQKS